MTEIEELRALHCVVKHAQWHKAAEELGVNDAKLQQTVSRLEQRLGVRLLTAEGDGLSLTEAGVAFHARTIAALETLEEIEASVRNEPAEPSGSIRISAPAVFGQSYVAPLLSQLRERHPRLAVHLTLTDRFVDLMHENVDLAIRIGAPFDSRLAGERLCTNRRVLVASPEYLRIHGTPSQPSELSRHECILFTSAPNPHEWKLTGPDGPVTIAVSGMIHTNHGHVLNSAAEQSLGITFGPTLSLADALLDGRLVRVLPDYTMARTDIYAVHCASSPPPAKIRATVEFLKRHFVDPPSWDQRLDGKVAGF